MLWACCSLFFPRLKPWAALAPNAYVTARHEAVYSKGFRFDIYLIEIDYGKLENSTLIES